MCLGTTRLRSPRLPCVGPPHDIEVLERPFAQVQCTYVLENPCALKYPVPPLLRAPEARLLYHDVSSYPSHVETSCSPRRELVSLEHYARIMPNKKNEQIHTSICV